MNLSNFMKINKINQIYISDCIKNNITSLLDNISYQEYNNKYDNAIFWGLYTMNDLGKFKLHKGNKTIIWAGNEADLTNKTRKEILEMIKSVNVQFHLTVKADIYRNLKNFGLNINLISIKSWISMTIFI